ncbi:protein-disulfide reductase DsbD family protein [Micavibrio aeruginosavorus]|uniref:Cytochrome c-type biogenesis protein DsbD, protein-disulfide reductase n=1 Tax=Micavibrio aeruginosavorus EPB TaxID=349215 RepID=M4VCX8_9BACT|nr:protein-disulfide reductase DsbD domain-containing protein [Micavibrio aeruginosavorus]AGH97063.1 Cytochrome c-type biogenesis protein DsbD, protein-disulfide reductase [Micavibrio aeruginosavorus EPB]
MRFRPLLTLASLLALVSMLAVSTGPVQAQPVSAEPNVTIRLIPEQNPIEAGTTFQVAVDQTINDGWHTYWLNPGDSGMAPNITWTLPDGFTAGALHWPTPHAVPYAGLMNYGYENAATLLQDITVPATLPAGPITIKADVEILVCKDICIPEFSSHEITLNAGDGTDTPADSTMITAARAAQPTTLDATATYSTDATDFIITITPNNPAALADLNDPALRVFPHEWGAIINNASPAITTTGETITIRQTRDTTRAVEELGSFDIVLAANGRAHRVTIEPGAIDGAAPSAPSPTQDPSPAPAAPTTTLMQALLFALLGGMVLNLMPCVFPVLSLKALKLVQMQGKDKDHARAHGLAYTAGILVCFGIVAGALIALKSGGAQIGWGFQLQNPQVILALAYLLFVIGLSLSGVFEFGGQLAGVGQKLAGQSGLRGSFFTGMLATIVATPCTAPFMAAALGYALVQPPVTALSVFMALGFGLALPYLALCFIPALARALPKPGAWMLRFREFLAFPMYGSAVWLVWVLSLQSGPHGVLAALVGMVLIAFALWMLSHRPDAGMGRMIITLLGLIALALALLPFAPMSKPMMDTAPVGMVQTANGDAEPFTTARLNELLATDQAVFINMTAAWCITCKVNERVAIATMDTMNLFKDKNIAYLKGDWTNQNPDITKFLESYGRNGVPLYVYYPPAVNGTRPDAVVLPQLLTPGIVADVINPE